VILRSLPSPSHHAPQLARRGALILLVLSYRYAVHTHTIFTHTHHAMPLRVRRLPHYYHYTYIFCTPDCLCAFQTRVSAMQPARRFLSVSFGIVLLYAASRYDGWFVVGGRGFLPALAIARRYAPTVRHHAVLPFLVTWRRDRETDSAFITVHYCGQTTRALSRLVHTCGMTVQVLAHATAALAQTRGVSWDRCTAAWDAALPHDACRCCRCGTYWRQSISPWRHQRVVAGVRTFCRHNDVL